MAKISVFYDFHDDGIKPITMIISVKIGELDHSKSSIYIPLYAPFRRQMVEEFDDEFTGLSVLLDDLIVNPAHPSKFGITLSQIRQRHSKSELEQVGQLFIRICDIEEVMQMNVQKVYGWR